MLVEALLVLRAVGAPLDTTAIHPSIIDTALSAAVVDTPSVRRRHAISYSDQYYTRLTIHRYGSYAMLPLFAAEYSLGQNLINDANPSSWIKPTHTAVALGIGALFGVNTITGAWNLWESRDDPSNRGLRITHTVLMLASDAGFAITGALTPKTHSFDFSEVQSSRNRHRNWAIGSMALSTAGTALMWFWKH
ncbi:MAG TPA: hypothetical protein VN706_16170 [Gemmatimonadaceae bacterium]|nr:hypothetical protein [Gemmatimonadaceae bacterium]